MFGINFNAGIGIIAELDLDGPIPSDVITNGVDQMLISNNYTINRYYP